MNNLIFRNNNNFEENRSTPKIKIKNKKNKLDFKKIKKNTCKSLNEVEYFLNNLKKFTDYVKLYKILK